MSFKCWHCFQHVVKQHLHNSWSSLMAFGSWLTYVSSQETPIICSFWSVELLKSLHTFIRSTTAYWKTNRLVQCRKPRTLNWKKLHCHIESELKYTEATHKKNGETHTGVLNDVLSRHAHNYRLKDLANYLGKERTQKALVIHTDEERARH